MNAVFNAL